MVDQITDALKIAWIEYQITLELKKLLLSEPTEEQKKQMLKSFGREVQINERV